MNDWRPSASHAALQQRAACAAAARHFLAERGVLEVDVPICQQGANLDRGVEVLTLGSRHLATSPEHPLKRLIAAGYGDVFALVPCFRSGEQGANHNPEFRMLEWYRCGLTLADLIAETIALVSHCSALPEDHEVISYREACVRHAGIDPTTSGEAALRAHLGERAQAARDMLECMDLLLALEVQPQLPSDRWTVITAWPRSMAAQARIDDTGMAARFEIYRGNLELANGYHECSDATDIAGRFSDELSERDDTVRIDERYLAALNAGLPDCCGVAVGFDRLVMLATGATSISEVLPFDWNRA